MGKILSPHPSTQRRYRPPDVPLAAIRHYAKRIATRFQPDTIILFGSFASGKPHADSDVDLLVVMACANQTTQAIRIRLAVEAPFPLDLIVRTPQNLRRRLADGNWFLREVMAQGIVLYEKGNSKLDPKSRSRSARRSKNGRRKATAS